VKASLEGAAKGAPHAAGERHSCGSVHNFGSSAGNKSPLARVLLPGLSAPYCMLGIDWIELASCFEQRGTKIYGFEH